MAEIPDDDKNRTLVVRDAESAEHLGFAGDTYTVLLSGDDTGGRYCLIDMHVPSGGGPGLHRHDFEETFSLLLGELEFTFRGETTKAMAGTTVHIPANAPHKFHNVGEQPARMLCICSPAGQERFFEELSARVGTRTEPPPKLEGEELKKVMEKAKALAPRYRTELL